MKFISGVFERKKPLSNMKIVIDCSHGAAYKIAPRILSNLGVEVVPIGCSPNGYNINLKSGSTNLENIAKTVPALSADLGIALDGDADRVALIDPTGKIIEGDQMLYILSRHLIANPKFNSKVVGTILTNSGLEKSLKKQGIDLYRSTVGDKNVLNLMKQTGSIIGGENSGHIINLEYSPSGDGLMTALLVIKVMINEEKSLDQLLDGLELVPQFNQNIEVDFSTISNEAIKIIADKANTEINDGRVLVRKSGTEPVIRVTIETLEQKTANIMVETIKAQIKKI
jgi:phosphoglucosamine mutase